MITEDTLVYNKGVHVKEDYSVQAFVIDNEVVDIFAVPKTFLGLYHSSTLVEVSFENDRYEIDVVKEGSVVERVSVPEKLGAILLSKPLLVELSVEKNNYQVIPGMKYVDGTTWE
jgi:hypothetical protein